MELKEGQVYNRADIVNFMGLDLNATIFQRMKGFTDNGKSMNPTTYDRRYVDEKNERSDVVSYATEIAYGFDRMVGNAVHDVISRVHDEELVGFNIPIVTVNFNEPVEGGYKAKYRTWNVQPDSNGDSTDAYTYSGAFKANGSIVTGIAKIEEGNTNDTTTITSISFTADGEQATQLVTFNVSDADGQVANAKIAINTGKTIYTDVNGIVMVDLPKGAYSKVSISKSGYTAQSNVSITVDNAPIYKAITLVKAS